MSLDLVQWNGARRILRLPGQNQARTFADIALCPDRPMALNGTEKSFSLDVASNAVSLNLGEAYAPLGGENAPWGEEELPDASLRRNEFTLNRTLIFCRIVFILTPFSPRRPCPGNRLRLKPGLALKSVARHHPAGKL